MENNITNFVEQLKKDNQNISIDSYDLYILVKDNEKLLKRMCEAVMNSYDNIEHIKKFLG